MSRQRPGQRRRELARDERAGRYARRRHREAYRSYLRLHWRLLGGAAGLMFGATALVAVVVHSVLVRGIVIGFGVAASMAVLSHFVVLASGAGPLMMGELAEQWTARELRRLPIGGWRVINHFGVGRGDIDHVVVGSPGVFVIETKWSASSWTEDRAESVVAVACRQAERAARQVSLWENYKRLGVPAPRPLVALWGNGAADLSKSLGRSDVLVGSDVSGRLESFGLVNARLNVEQVDRVWEVLSDHLRGRDAREAEEQPMPESIQALVGRFATGVAAGLISFLAAAYLMKAGLPLWAWFVVVLTTVAAEQVVRRRVRLRHLVTGSEAGLVATALLAVAAAGAQIVR